MKAIRNTAAGLSAAALLAGCGSGARDSSAETATSADWAADACKTFPADLASKAAGMTVTQATASPGASVGGTRVSTCNYTASDGTIFTLLLRQSPDSTMEEAITGLKANPEMTGPMEEVAVAGGKGFWAPRLKTYTYLPDGQRLISVTPPGVRLGGKSDADDVLKQKAEAIAEAAAKAG